MLLYHVNVNALDLNLIYSRCIQLSYSDVHSLQSAKMNFGEFGQGYEKARQQGRNVQERGEYSLAHVADVRRRA